MLGGDGGGGEMRSDEREGGGVEGVGFWVGVSWTKGGGGKYMRFRGEKVRKRERDEREAKAPNLLLRVSMLGKLDSSINPLLGSSS